MPTSRTGYSMYYTQTIISRRYYCILLFCIILSECFYLHLIFFVVLLTKFSSHVLTRRDIDYNKLIESVACTRKCVDPTQLHRWHIVETYRTFFDQFRHLTFSHRSRNVSCTILFFINNYTCFFFY